MASLAIALGVPAAILGIGWKGFRKDPEDHPATPRGPAPTPTTPARRVALAEAPAAPRKPQVKVHTDPLGGLMGGGGSIGGGHPGFVHLTAVEPSQYNMKHASHADKPLEFTGTVTNQYTGQQHNTFMHLPPPATGDYQHLASARHLERHQGYAAPADRHRQELETHTLERPAHRFTHNGNFELDTRRQATAQASLMSRNDLRVEGNKVESTWGDRVQRPAGYEGWNPTNETRSMQNRTIRERTVQTARGEMDDHDRGTWMMQHANAARESGTAARHDVRGFEGTLSENRGKAYPGPAGVGRGGGNAVYGAAAPSRAPDVLPSKVRSSAAVTTRPAPVEPYRATAGPNRQLPTRITRQQANKSHRPVVGDVRKRREPTAPKMRGTYAGEFRGDAVQQQSLASKKRTEGRLRKPRPAATQTSSSRVTATHRAPKRREQVARPAQATMRETAARVTGNAARVKRRAPPKGHVGRAQQLQAHTALPTTHRRRDARKEVVGSIPVGKSAASEAPAVNRASLQPRRVETVTTIPVAPALPTASATRDGAMPVRRADAVHQPVHTTSGMAAAAPGVSPDAHEPNDRKAQDDIGDYHAANGVQETSAREMVPLSEILNDRKPEVQPRMSLGKTTTDTPWLQSEWESKGKKTDVSLANRLQADRAVTNERLL